MNNIHIKDLIHNFILGIERFPGIKNEFDFLESNLDAFEKNMLNKQWDLTVCSYCANAQVLFDVINPSDSSKNSVKWSAVRITIRCAKSAEKFIVGYTKIFGEVPTPGLYTYRAFPCPLFEEYRPGGPETKP